MTCIGSGLRRGRRGTSDHPGLGSFQASDSETNRREVRGTILFALAFPVSFRSLSVINMHLVTVRPARVRAVGKVIPFSESYQAQNIEKGSLNYAQ